MEKIAIIGTACLFPEADTPDAYWENLVANKDSRVTAQAEQMGRDPQDYFSPAKDTKDNYYCTTGGYINGFQFDAQNYSLDANTLNTLDNTFQWALHVAREALKDSGYYPSSANNQQTNNKCSDNDLSRCGVILGNLSFPTKKSNALFSPLYHQAMATPLKDLFGSADFSMGDKASNEFANGMVAGHPASIINDALNLGDVSVVLDAACASSLYSMKLACSYLQSHKADMMLAGAVSAADPWFVAMGFSTFKAFPENIASCPLDKNSSGLNTGEGAGMFVLKRYDDALRDGDTIHAVISGIGLSNDGKGKFVLSPNEAGQTVCYERAYKSTHINPEDVDYVECHATGTPLGDATEIHSMENFFANKDVHFTMGTAKSNFGHLLTSAGMAGMLKIILAMKNDLLPATVHIKEPLQSSSDKIAGDNILTQNKAWPDSTNKVAAISAFGFGGTNAHLILEEASEASTTQSSIKKKITPTTEALSIIGMGAYFGQSKDLTHFEQLIYNAQALSSPLPKNRWQGIDQDRAILEQFGIAHDDIELNGNFIDQFDFDHLYFKIPPEEQAPLLPQQLLMMKVIDEALQDAKLPKGGNIGVIVAMEMDLGIHQFRGRIDIAWQLQESLKNSHITLTVEQQAQLTDILKDSLHNAVEINQFTSFIGNIIPCRICSLWDFSGPAFTISSEENSTFKALEVAQLFLDSGDVDAMVVGAVDMAGGIEHIYLQKQRNADYAPNWRIGEGGGALVLKRQDQVLNSDRVYASIDSFSGVRFKNNQDMANSLKQAADRTLQQANITRNVIDYIELNSSAMSHHEQAEIDSLKQLYPNAIDSSEKPTQTCALGSVKANIGHTFVASGMASVIKTALCLYQRFIPGVADSDILRSTNDWDETQFYFPQASRPWLLNSQQKKRYAMINNLGQDNTAFNVIMSDTASSARAEKSKVETNRAEKKPVPNNHYLDGLDFFLVPLYADSEQALHTQLVSLSNDIQATTELNELAWGKLTDFTKYAQDARYRMSLLAHSIEELQREIQSAIKGISNAFNNNEEWSTPLGSYFTPNPQAQKGKVAFVYPGGFNSYIGMSSNLFQLFPEITDLVADSTSSLRQMMRTHYVYPQTLNAPDKKTLKQLEAQMGDDAVAMFESGIMSSILYTKVIQDLLGVQPQAAFGHSMGELSMLFSSGAWDNTDYMSNTLHSTPTFHNRLVGEMDVVRQAWDLPPSSEDEKPIWGTYTLRISPEKAAEVLAEEERVFLIIINAPNEIVIAGDDEACRRVVKKLKWRLFPVPIKDVVHNELVKAEFDALKRLHTMPTTTINGIDFYTAANYQKTELKEDVIGHNIATFYTQMVDFPKLVRQVYDDGARIFIELGPQSSCTKWVSESLKGKEHLAVGINRKGVDDHTSLLKMAAKLSSHGLSMALDKLCPKPQTLSVDDNKPSLVKPVILGKKPFAEVILSAENRVKFKPMPISTPPISTPVVHHEQKKDIPKSAPNYKTSLNTSKVVVNAQPVTTQKIGQETVGQSSIQSDVKQHHPSARIQPLMEQSMTHVISDTTANLSAKAYLIPNYQSDMLHKMIQHNIQLSQMHTEFMASRHDGLQSLSAAIINNIHSPDSHVRNNNVVHSNHSAQNSIVVLDDALSNSTKNTNSVAQEGIRQLFPSEYSQAEQIIFSEQDLREFAYGKIGNVFGSDYDSIDCYSRRVMLPMDPYLLVTRVTEMQAKKGAFVPSKMTTEYDIPHNAWYSTDGQIPTCICIESGQCDLLLISYMGIDFDNKGKYLYRLLDCTLTFLDDQPKEGQTLRYEISINSFAKHKNNLLFFFSYECFVGDKMILKMDNGCAGFFSDEELAVGKGVIRTKEEIEARAKVQKTSFTPILHCQKTSFDEKDMYYLMEGDLASCYANPDYDKKGTNPSLHFPLEKILMLDRVTSVDRTGGLWGLGLIEAEKDLSPDEWYFTSHFRDDPVLAGSLMSEGCVQLLQFFMLYLGLQTKTIDARFQTMQNIPQPIRCRGQALPKDRLMTYRLEVTEIGLSPKPYARGNVDIIIDGKIVVDFRDVCLELSEKSAQEKQLLASPRQAVTLATPSQKSVQAQVTAEIKTVMPSLNKKDTRLPELPAIEVKPALFSEAQIVHFATGDIEACFGSEFALYKQPPPTPQDPPRRPPRTPNGYLQLMHRVLSVEGQRHDFDNTTKCVAEYDVAPNVWFCTENSYESLTPYSMLMEIALQPNGFLTSHIGSTLMYPDTNLYFRNLDGTGRLIKEMDLRGKTIVNKTTMFSTSAVMNNIIQKFTFELLVDGETFYEGDAVFGFFSAESLANQVGMDKGKKLLPWYKEEANIQAKQLTFNLRDESAQSLFKAPANKPNYRLAGGVFNFLDESLVIADGGKFGKGYVHSLKVIDETDWFYPCHFYQDPVMPGSLGVEAMIQSLQVFALQQNLAQDFINPRFGLVEGEAKWTYRGQIIPDNEQMTLEVHIKEIRTRSGRVDIVADGNLWKDGLRIYSVETIGLSIQEAK